MKKKIRPSELKSKQIREIFNREGALAIDDFHRLGQEKLYQEALEAEVDDFLGRKWHQPSLEGHHTGYRNGYYARRLRVPGSRLDVAVRESTQHGHTKICKPVAERMRPNYREAKDTGLGDVRKRAFNPRCGRGVHR